MQNIQETYATQSSSSSDLKMNKGPDWIYPPKILKWSVGTYEDVQYH